MYIPAVFSETRLPVLHDFVRNNSFATVVTSTTDGLLASHVPVLLLPDRGNLGSLQLHLARQNDHCNSLAAGEKTLFIFHGPHAYISPTWYATPARVPTWNYIVVHARGTPRAMSDSEFRIHLTALASAYESSRNPSWTTDRIPADAFDKLQRAIIGFELEITSLEGKWKLGQNRTEADRHGAIRGLRESGDFYSLAIADQMMATLAESTNRT